MKITKYTVETEKINTPLSLACVSDLHGRDPRKVIEALRSMRPDLILLAGDIFEVANEYMEKRNINAMKFIEAIKDIAPIYYCFGNHEVYYSHATKKINRIPNPDIEKNNIEKILSLGIHLINDTCEESCICGNTLYIGGIVCGDDTDPDKHFIDPDLSYVEKLDTCLGFKILICHYPHYYEKYLKNSNLDLILSGHAHGGQWRIFNRGIYAPHQGLFPKYTSGIHDGRHIINRGAVNNSMPIPRIFNPPEIVEILLINKDRKTR